MVFSLYSWFNDNLYIGIGIGFKECQVLGHFVIQEWCECIFCGLVVVDDFVFLLFDVGVE
jgi:hypothetical protein